MQDDCFQGGPWRRKAWTASPCWVAVGDTRLLERVQWRGQTMRGHVAGSHILLRQCLGFSSLALLWARNLRMSARSSTCDALAFWTALICVPCCHVLTIAELRIMEGPRQADQRLTWYHRCKCHCQQTAMARHGTTACLYAPSIVRAQLLLEPQEQMPEARDW
jgi:hypothetical protein